MDENRARGSGSISELPACRRETPCSSLTNIAGMHGTPHSYLFRGDPRTCRHVDLASQSAIPSAAQRSKTHPSSWSPYATRRKQNPHRRLVAHKMGPVRDESPVREACARGAAPLLYGCVVAREVGELKFVSISPSFLASKLNGRD
jgi:hypothetical protein